MSQYSIDLIIRFVAAYATIGLFSYIIERVRQKIQDTLIKTNHELQVSLSEVKTLSGLLPICASCKNIRDDKGYWNQIDHYIEKHSDVDFSHGICPDCMAKLYPEIAVNDPKKEVK